MAAPAPPPGFEWADWLAAALQNGWAAASVALIAGFSISFYFLRQWQQTYDRLIVALENQNKLADRVALVMERLERKAERR